MPKHEPAISVVLPVYNAERYIAAAILSILNQTFTDFELIIVDDGSTDNSTAVICSFKDERIKYHKNETNLKLVATLNRGFSLAKGKYIARMDADDIAYPERLQEQYKFLEEHPEVGLCGTWYRSFGNIDAISKLEVEHFEILFKLLYQFHFLHPSWMIRKDIVIKYNIEYKILYGEDYDFVYQLLPYTRFANLPKVLMDYRQFADSMSKSNYQITMTHCKEIKLKIFKKMGCEIDLNELELFEKISQYQYTLDKSFLPAVEMLLSKMIEANKQSRFFPLNFLSGKAYFLWYHSCLNSSSLGFFAFNQFYRSPLSRLQFNPFAFLKVLVKSVVKK